MILTKYPLFMKSKKTKGLKHKKWKMNFMA